MPTLLKYPALSFLCYAPLLKDIPQFETNYIAMRLYNMHMWNLSTRGVALHIMALLEFATLGHNA